MPNTIISIGPAQKAAQLGCFYVGRCIPGSHMFKKHRTPLLILCIATAALFVLETLLADNDYIVWFGLFIQCALAFGAGYWVILRDAQQGLAQSAMLAAFVGVVGPILGLPRMLLFPWHSVEDFATAFAWFLFSSVIMLMAFALLGAFGGKVRKLLAGSIGSIE